MPRYNKFISYDFYWMPHPDKPMICPECKTNHLESQISKMVGRPPPMVAMLGPASGAYCRNCKSGMPDMSGYYVLEGNGDSYVAPWWCLMMIPVTEQRDKTRCTHVIDLMRGLQMQCTYRAKEEGKCRKHSPLATVAQ